jgi:hypothetical protein
MTLVKLELRVRDWYVPHSLFMSLQIGYLKLEEIFKSQRKMSLIIHFNPTMTLVKLELRVRDWYVPHSLFMSLQICYLILEEKSYKRIVKVLR